MLATGPPGPIPLVDYCKPQCYAKGYRDRRDLCECKGCDGDAHGRGKKYAFEHGYLKYSPPGSRKPKIGQEDLFLEDGCEDELIERPICHHDDDENEDL